MGRHTAFARRDRARLDRDLGARARAGRHAQAPVTRRAGNRRRGRRARHRYRVRLPLLFGLIAGAGIIFIAREHIIRRSPSPTGQCSSASASARPRSRARAHPRRRRARHRGDRSDALSQAAGPGRSSVAIRRARLTTQVSCRADDRRETWPSRLPAELTLDDPRGDRAVERSPCIRAVCDRGRR